MKMQLDISDIIDELTPGIQFSPHVSARWDLQGMITVHWYGQSFYVDPVDLITYCGGSFSNQLKTFLENTMPITSLELSLRKVYLGHNMDGQYLHVNRGAKCIHTLATHANISFATPAPDDFTITQTGGILCLDGKIRSPDCALTQGREFIASLIKDFCDITPQTCIILHEQPHQPMTIGHISLLRRMSEEMTSPHHMLPLDEILASYT